ncbi:MAG TPA: hypothetical protein VFL29_15225 [Candidatus Dormibacteraeota bacterium]|nr:hypothetical protein [Candidatus Dormibacteraeota bacterium]
MRAAVLAALVVVLAACSTSPAPAAAISQSPASAARTGPVISPPPVTPPTPPGDNTQAFSCTDVSGGTAGTVRVTDVRVTEEPGYDRFVIQFDGTVPSFTVKRQSKPVFVQGGSGQTITLSGTTGVLVTLHTSSEAATYSGPTDFTQTDFAVLKEARLTEDFEGTVAWGLGLGSAACMRVFVVKTSPARLIVDFATTSG